MFGLDVNLHDDGSWLCQHVDGSESPGPPTRLSLQQTVEENTVSLPGFPTSAPRRSVHCPDCGTRWRIWVQQKIARPYIEWGPEQRATPPPYRRAPVRDIDRIIALVREQLPCIDVTQYQQKYPADNDGLWWFRQRGIDGDIQMESSDGMCPFLVEDYSMQTPAEAWRALTVREAAQGVIHYLVGSRSGRAEFGCCEESEQ